MASLDNNRLVRAFAELRSQGRKTVLPFVTAGFPDLATTEALLGEFAARGVRVCELGIPFSDPVADGPVIQASYTDALAAGVTTDKIMEMVRHFRQSSERSVCRTQPSGLEPAHPTPAHPTELAVVAMISYSIVFRHGPAAFCAQARDAGIDGLIIPDLPLDEAAALEGLASAAGLANIMLIAPTTPPARRLEIARHSRGFIYYISIAGITGERTQLPPATVAAVAELRTHTETPVCVGFGVSSAATVAEVCKSADGAIVGSAIVHRVAQAKQQGLPTAQIAKRVGDFITELLAPLA